MTTPRAKARAAGCDSKLLTLVSERLTEIYGDVVLTQRQFNRFVSALGDVQLWYMVLRDRQRPRKR